MTTLVTVPTFDDPELDPFAEPAVTHDLGMAPDRALVVIEGTVRAADVVRWAGGPVLEVVVVDPIGAVTLVFFGRERMAGVEPGCRLVARGRVGRHRGRRVILNPATWIHADQVAGSDDHPFRPTHRTVAIDLGGPRANGSRDRATTVP